MNSLSSPRMSSWAASVAVVAFNFVSTPLFAYDTDVTDDSQELKEIVEAQQQELEQQQQESDAQERMLQELLQRVEALASERGQPPAPTGDQPTPAPVTATAKDQAKAGQDWPGSFSLFGSDTRLAIGGFVQLDVIYDSDAIGTPGLFSTAAIPTDGGTLADGADGRTSFSVNTSRLTLESRTPTELGRVKTFFSADLFGDALSTSPEFRLRQAYGELEGALWGGNLLLGQAWGTYVDLDAWPDILDFEGPGSAIAIRQPMVRWSKGCSDSVGVQVALEEPGGGTIQGADTLTRWPDLIGTVKWAKGGGHLRGAGMLRDVRASADDRSAVNATGWGLAGSGKVNLFDRNNLVFEVSYGEGVGDYYNDGPTVGVVEPADSGLDLVPVFAYYAGYEHGWSSSLSSAVLYSAIEVDNLDSQPDDAYKKGAYFSLNLIWRPDPSLMFGIEFLSGGRRDKDGAEGTDNRVQLSSRFSF